MRILVAILLAVAAFGVMSPSGAQQVQRIAAIVSDDVVSMFDLQARIQMVIETSGLAATPEVRRRLAPQILRTLIDERLRLCPHQRGLRHVFSHRNVPTVRVAAQGRSRRPTVGDRT